MIKKYLLLRPLVLGGQVIDAGTEYDLEEAEAKNIGLDTSLSEVQNSMEEEKKEEEKKEEGSENQEAKPGEESSGEESDDQEQE